MLIRVNNHDRLLGVIQDIEMNSVGLLAHSPFATALLGKEDLICDMAESFISSFVFELGDSFPVDFKCGKVLLKCCRSVGDSLRSD